MFIFTKSAKTNVYCHVSWFVDPVLNSAQHVKMMRSIMQLMLKGRKGAQHYSRQCSVFQTHRRIQIRMTFAPAITSAKCPEETHFLHVQAFPEILLLLFNQLSKVKVVLRFSL